MNLNHILQVLPDELLKQGILLEKSVGVKEIAWGYPAIIKVIAVIKKNNLIILGGDVYTQSNGVLEMAYANWYFNVDLADTMEHNVNHSVETAMKYINNYSDKNNSYYSLVIRGT